MKTIVLWCHAKFNLVGFRFTPKFACLYNKKIIGLFLVILVSMIHLQRYHIHISIPRCTFLFQFFVVIIRPHLNVHMLHTFNSLTIVILMFPTEQVISLR
jgi:hypothetical protein